ncbi:MAG: tetratricopeptide repeat protein [Chloroflexota bacterium]
MWRGVKTALLLLLVVGLQLGPERRQPAALIREGDAHVARQEYSFAAQKYRQAATLQPGSAVPLLRLGRTYLAQAWYDRAQPVLLLVHRRQGWTPHLHLLMGQLYLGMGLEAEAMAQWQAALTGDPHLAEARAQLGWAYLRNEAWVDAQSSFEVILARWDPDHRFGWQSAHYGLGLILARHEPQAALHHLQIAAAGPDLEMAQRAIVLGAELEQLSLASDAIHAAAALGQAYVRVEAWSLARQVLAGVVDTSPDYAEARAYLGHALDYLGRSAEAEQHLWRAVQLAPTQTLPRYLLGLYYLRHGRAGEAVFQLRQALKLDPYEPVLYAQLGQAWLAQDNYTDAEMAFRAAAELAPESADFQLLLARFYIERLVRVRAGGLPAAQSAARMDPSNAQAHDVLGWAYYLVGYAEQAESALLRAVALDPELASARYHLGAVLQQAGQPAQAREQFWRAVDLDRTGFYRARAMRALGLPIE